MYISKPPITPKHSAQLDNKPSVALHQGKGNVTTVMAVDNLVRHPVSQKFLGRFQNQQSQAPNLPVTDTTKGGMYTSGKAKQ